MKRRRIWGGLAGLSLAVIVCLLTQAVWAARPKTVQTSLDQKEFFLPELYISSSTVPLGSIAAKLPNRAAWQDASAQKAAAGSSFIVHVDPRSGVAASILGAEPLIPGDGAGNALTLDQVSQRLGAPVTAITPVTVARAARSHIAAKVSVLGIDPAQMGATRATQVRPDYWQISIPQVYKGVPVRHGRLALTISHGNVVAMGAESWGNVDIDTLPYMSADQAVDAGFNYLEGRQAADVIVQEPMLEIVPIAPPQHQAGDLFKGAPGQGYGHRLVWSYVFVRPPSQSRWEVLVDAHTGEVISFQDTNQYVQRQISGGVYPLTATGICPNADQCGTMQTGWPMPFANTGLASPNNFTNSAGIFNWTSGTVTTTLSGQFVRISDSCGAISNSSTTGDINLGGTNNQHDCTTGGGSAGNTPAARTGFYELNKLIEQARGYLPSNNWLNQQLTSNMNINQTCNAFWSTAAGTVNFYRSGGGCRNTGELAGVFDHEWGHGLDDNDAAGSLSNSSEGYADIAAIYRLEASCVGHGFFQTLDDGCGQTSDGTGFNSNEAQQGAAHCDTDCSGVRDADWAKHNPNTPDTALGFVCTSCLTGPGPCGRQVHCAAAPSRQAAWDFATRDLTAAPFNLDSQTAFLVANRVFYQGSGNIGSWHTCTCGSASAGCGATNAYIQWLTADDDNGNINDGTPHMTALFNAFNRHGIACATPTATNSGCAGGPTAASTLSATPGNYQVGLSWTAVTGAANYQVYRSEGHAGCNFGKAKIATVTGTSFTDTQVANGRQYYYNVVAAGSSQACAGRASNCVTVTPNGTVTPDFSISCSPSSLSAVQGGSANSTCTIASTGGFSSAVNLSCSNLPAGVTCGYSPNPVTPPANGSTNSALTVSVAGSTPTGTYNFQAAGTSGATTRTANISLTVTPVQTPNFSIACSPSSLSAAQGGSAASTCTVTSTGGFSSAVALDCASLPAGVTCGYVPPSVTPPANGSANSALTVSVAGSTPTGNYNFQARGTSGSTVRTANIALAVTPPGGGDQTAVFDATLQTPRCGTVGRSCDSGASLLLGRGTMSPAEPNQPNTINDSCADGGSGTFHFDESNDRIKVSTTDGTNFAPGKTVRIDATVWAWTTPSSDHLDLYYAANASSPSWTFITTITPTVVGSQVLSATYTLPTGAVQGVRARFRYLGSATPCGTGSFNDHDDLVFAVTSAPVTTVFSDNFEAAGGWVGNPNGTDTATTGAWERGDPEQTTSGGVKQLGTTTSGVNDLVTARLAGASAGVNDIDGGVTSIASGNITLPASGPLTLTFQYYLAHGSNSSSADFFRARIIGPSGTTTVFQSLGAATNRNGAWTAASANLASFAGQTIRILFEASDLSTASLVEAGVDDVKITQP